MLGLASGSVLREDPKNIYITYIYIWLVIELGLAMHKASASPAILSLWLRKSCLMGKKTDKFQGLAANMVLILEKFGQKVWKMER